MRCSGSPTTCTAIEARNLDGGAGAQRRREVAARFEALLFAAALKPLAGALGFFGDAAVEAAALKAARSHEGGLHGVFERLLASERQ